MAYPKETVVAEKLEALTMLGLLNSRIKEYYDIALLARLYPFNGDLLAEPFGRHFDIVAPQHRPGGQCIDFLHFRTVLQTPWHRPPGLCGAGLPAKPSGRSSASSAFSVTRRSRIRAPTRPEILGASPVKMRSPRNLCALRDSAVNSSGEMDCSPSTGQEACATGLKNCSKM